MMCADKRVGGWCNLLTLAGVVVLFVDDGVVG